MVEEGGRRDGGQSRVARRSQVAGVGRSSSIIVDEESAESVASFRRPLCLHVGLCPQVGEPLREALPSVRAVLTSIPPTDGARRDGGLSPPESGHGMRLLSSPPLLFNRSLSLFASLPAIVLLSHTVQYTPTHSTTSEAHLIISDWIN